MSQLSSFLKDANIFKNYTPTDHTCVAVKGDSQIFSASSNVVKTAPILLQKNYFKLLNISSCAPFRVQSLLLNHNETLLAVVGESTVAIIDVKDSADFDSPDPVWDCFDVSLSLPKETYSRIKAILWHPASSKNSQLVILTETDILLYDIVFSLTHPMLTVPLSQYPALKGKTVSSIAFGSSQDFAGVISLYLSTVSGEIFALYPFTYKFSSLTTTKASLSTFVEDWSSCLSSYEAKLPPASVFATYRAVFAKQSAFVAKLETKLSSPLFAEADDNQTLSLDVDDDGTSMELLGPLATIGPHAKLIQTNVNGRTPILASIHQEPTGNVMISYFSQIIPLTLAIDKPGSTLREPIKPVRIPKQPKDIHYSKPVRGFGYVIESDEEEVDHDEEFDMQMHIYHEELGFYNTKLKINAFIDATFNKLTVLATDSTDLKYTKNTQLSFQNIRDSKILVSSGKSLLIGDSAPAATTMFNPDSDSFDVHYKLIETSPISTSFAYVKDTIEGTGDYLIACSSTEKIGIFQVENFKNDKKESTLEAKISSNKLEPDLRVRHTTLPAEELSLIKAESAKPLKGAHGIDLTQFESLDLVHHITSDSTRKVKALTKFLIALQMKVEIQFEDLKLQTKDLLSVNEKTVSKEKYGKNQERIETLFARQEKLIEREEALRDKIVERFEKARAAQKLPLSHAEREWFKELNSITKAVTMGDQKAPSLSARLETLRSKVAELKLKKQTQPAEEQLNEMLSSLSLGTNLSRIALNLSQEGEILVKSKVVMDGCLERLQETLQT